MKFSKNQQTVIDLRNKNILVSAAAGSGKTTVLVERIIKLIVNDNEDIDKFLIVTFTNAAASGMKQKIHKSLVKEVLKGSDNDHLRRQLNMLSKSSISTIHSFCIDVVRRNFHVVGIDPNFRIGDVNEVDILLNDVIDEVLENAYAQKKEGFIRLVESFTGNRGDKELNEIIKDVYKFILSFPDPLEWLEENVDMLDISGDELKDSMWLSAVKDNLNLLLDGAGESLEFALELCREPDGPTVYEDTIAEDLNSLKNLKETLESDFTLFTRKAHSVVFPALKALRGKAKDETDIRKQEDVKESREEYKKAIKTINSMIPLRTLEEFAGDIEYMHVPMRALFELIQELSVKFKAAKLEKSIADFNDVEHYALQILRQTEISQTYKNKFKYIFIDEYQDSNRLQEELLNSVKSENNMFMVGDVKQSIYRFRLADPSIFNQKSDDYPNTDADGMNRRVDLNQNYRSRKEILDGINFIFSSIMSKELGEVDYNQQVFLNWGAEFEEISECVTELDIIDKNSAESEELDDEIKAMKTAELEAMVAVGKIRQLVLKDKNEPLKKDEPSLSKEKIMYKDIVILMRSVSSWAGIFEEIFSNEGIPFYFDGGEGYFESIEIQVILNLLKIIDNIRQDVPLLSVMRSPIGRFTTEELVKIRIEYPKYNYIDAVYEYKNKYDDELSLKIGKFVDMVEGWKKRSRYTHLNDFIWEVLMETDYYYFVGLLPKGNLRQANLRLLADKAFEFEKTAMFGLFNFLRYVEKLGAASGDTGSAKTLGENDNVVRLMSVHKSKGLEFPVVIMCGMNKKFNRTDVSKSILKHRIYGVAPKYINPDERIFRETFPRMAVKNIIKKENLSEEMRVLYVAMTRAVDRLIMIGTVNNFETKMKKWRKGPSIYNIYTEESYLDWICSCLFGRKDENFIMNAVNDQKFIYHVDCFKENLNFSSDWNINRITLPQISMTEEEGQKIKENMLHEINSFKNYEDLNMKNEIERRLDYKYAFSKSVNIPTKLSVTDIKTMKQEKIESIKYRIPVLRDIPQFKEDEKDFTKAEIGTVVHFVMQHLELHRGLNCEDISLQVEEMVIKKLLSEKEAAVVDERKIEEFFKSDIGIRMKESKDVKREVPFVIKKKAHEIIGSLNKEDVILIQGIIDCYFLEGEEAVIIDYKTDEVSRGGIEALKDEYSPQILSYKEAVEKITGRNVKECFLYLFDIGEAVKID
ncbi:helicase-exonuclease AddAB subunit AddA [Sedimentibacter saalensis]|uniref:helicase-exonuclease AddAB subunit AddA n=1 Tax=Sedimentibacter saalensis TaxID=130788 RepID=UPI0028A1B626|nr:helicase-exonuclease AddAB subunit AddA [Sedimentibacter saalensis]